MNQLELKEKINSYKNYIKTQKNNIKRVENCIKLLYDKCEHVNGTQIKTDSYESEYDGFVIEEQEICSLCGRVIKTIID